MTGERVLARWGEFLRPSFDEVVAAARVRVVSVAPDSAPHEIAPECDALYVRLPQYASEDVIASLPQLKVLAVPGAGLEVIDLEAATRHRIPVLNGRGMGQEAVADWTIGSIIWLVRRMGALHAAMSAGDWKSRFETAERHDVHRLTVGVIGYGQIGARVAKILGQGFGSRVLTNDRLEAAQAAARDDGFESVALDDLLRQSDVVTIHAQAVHGEAALLSREKLALMSSSAVLVNTARGALLDYAALADALAAGQLAGAALDVFDQEPPDQDLIERLTQHRNVLVSPHQAGMTDDATDTLARGVAASIVEVLDGGRPWNCANPEVWS